MILEGKSVIKGVTWETKLEMTLVAEETSDALVMGSEAVSIELGVWD